MLHNSGMRVEFSTFKSGWNIQTKINKEKAELSITIK